MSTAWIHFYAQFCQALRKNNAVAPQLDRLNKEQEMYENLRLLHVDTMCSMSREMETLGRWSKQRITLSISIPKTFISELLHAKIPQERVDGPSLLYYMQRRAEEPTSMQFKDLQQQSRQRTCTSAEAFSLSMQLLAFTLRQSKKHWSKGLLPYKLT